MIELLEGPYNYSLVLLHGQDTELMYLTTALDNWEYYYFFIGEIEKKASYLYIPVKRSDINDRDKQGMQSVSDMSKTLRLIDGPSTRPVIEGFLKGIEQKNDGASFFYHSTVVPHMEIIMTGLLLRLAKYD